jgi:hypothetical protein
MWTVWRYRSVSRVHDGHLLQPLNDDGLPGSNVLAVLGSRGTAWAGSLVGCSGSRAVAGSGCRKARLHGRAHQRCSRIGRPSLRGRVWHLPPQGGRDGSAGSATSPSWISPRIHGGVWGMATLPVPRRGHRRDRPARHCRHANSGRPRGRLWVGTSAAACRSSTSRSLIPCCTATTADRADQRSVRAYWTAKATSGSARRAASIAFGSRIRC